MTHLNRSRNIQSSKQHNINNRDLPEQTRPDMIETHTLKHITDLDETKGNNQTWQAQ